MGNPTNAASNFIEPIEPKLWLLAFTDQGGWYASMSDGQVKLGFSAWGFTERQKTKARAMITALSRKERELIEAEIRSRSMLEA